MSPNGLLNRLAVIYTFIILILQRKFAGEFKEILYQLTNFSPSERLLSSNAANIVSKLELNNVDHSRDSDSSNKEKMYKMKMKQKSCRATQKLRTANKKQVAHHMLVVFEAKTLLDRRE